MFLYAFVLCTIVLVVNGECPGGCDQPIAIYKDLKCEPIYAKPTDCCPMKYDCSNIAKRPADKCTYRGKSYDIREKIDDEVTYGNCKVGCYCQAPETINCAVLDCPEWLGVRPKPGYYFTYTLNKCCSTGQKTEPFETCKVGDIVYREGERFDSSKRCTQCVCQKGFDGKFVEPFCRETSCVEEMSNVPKIKANCAPNYLGENACCPYTWVCPDDEETEDTFVPGASAGGSTSVNAGQCKYGDKVLNVGDKFERIESISSDDSIEIKCECIIPPFVTCKQPYESLK